MNASDQLRPRPTRNRRRQYIIHPSFQWKYALSCSSTVFFLAFLLSAVLYSVLHNQAQAQAIDPSAYLTSVSLILVTFGAGFAALTAMGVGLWSILATHRFCGPMRVMENGFRELIAGRTPRTRPLRQKDEFKEFYEVYREAMTQVGKQRSAALDALQTAHTLIDSAIESEGETRAEALQMAAARLQSLIDDTRASAPEDHMTPPPRPEPAAAEGELVMV